jgi:hypothetical protein
MLHMPPGRYDRSTCAYVECACIVDDHGAITACGCQFGPVVGELEIPYLISVLAEFE